MQDMFVLTGDRRPLITAGNPAQHLGARLRRILAEAAIGIAASDPSVAAALWSSRERGSDR